MRKNLVYGDKKEVEDTRIVGFNADYCYTVALRH